MSSTVKCPQSSWSMVVLWILLLGHAIVSRRQALQKSLKSYVPDLSWTTRVSIPFPPAMSTTRSRTKMSATPTQFCIHQLGRQISSRFRVAVGPRIKKWFEWRQIKNHHTVLGTNYSNAHIRSSQQQHCQAQRKHLMFIFCISIFPSLNAEIILQDQAPWDHLLYS